MDILTLYRRTARAATDLEGLLSVSKMQNYNRVDSKTSEMAMVILLRDDETAATIFRSLDEVIEGVAELRADIEARRVAAAVQK